MISWKLLAAMICLPAGISLTIDAAILEKWYFSALGLLLILVVPALIHDAAVETLERKK